MDSMRDATERKPGDAWRVCVICGKGFWGNPAGKYCCAECREIGNKEHAKEQRARASKEERVCPICGKKFKCSEYSVRMFCSRLCKDKAHRKKTLDELAEGTFNDWIKGKGESVPKIEEFKGDRIAAINEYARSQHKTYGEIQAERMLEKMKREKEQ